MALNQLVNEELWDALNKKKNSGNGMKKLKNDYYSNIINLVNPFAIEIPSSDRNFFIL